MSTGVQPLVPTCTADQTLIVNTDFNPADAATFQPISWSYYQVIAYL